MTKTEQRPTKTISYLFSGIVLALLAPLVTGCGEAETTAVTDSDRHRTVDAPADEVTAQVEDANTDDVPLANENDAFCELIVDLDSVFMSGTAPGILPLTGEVDWLEGIVSESIAFSAVRNGARSDTSIEVDAPFAMFDVDKIVASDNLTETQAHDLLVSNGITPDIVDRFETADRALFWSREMMHDGTPTDARVAHSFAAYVSLCIECLPEWNENADEVEDGAVFLMPFKIQFVATDGPVNADGTTDSEDLIVGEFDFATAD